MASNRLALPSFVTGPNDAVVTVDVFSGTSGGIVNSIQSLAAKYDVDLIGMLRAGAAAAQLVPIVEGIANGRLLMNPQAAIARLLTASNLLTAAVGGTPISSAFNTLSQGVQEGIAAAGQIVGQVEATIGGVVSTIMNGAISDVAALGSIINSFASEGFQFLMTDNQALIGMAAGVINASARYGISGAFGAMISQISSPYILNGICQQVAPGLVSASDLVSLSALIRCAGPAGIRSINPSILINFTTSYSRRGTAASQQQGMPSADPDTWSDIVDCYNQANPSWNIASRVGDAAEDATLDLTSLQSGTEDFNAVLAGGVYANAHTDPSTTPTDTTTPFYALAPLYDAVDPNQQLKDMYPNTYIDPALRSTPMAVDPTQLQTGAGAAVNAATSQTAIQASSTDMTSNQIQVANDPVAQTPNPATYKTVGGKQYVTIPDGPDRGTYLITPNDTGMQAQANSINWGEGYWHSDEKYLYQPVNKDTLQPIK
jgi:hypothetical protein